MIAAGLLAAAPGSAAGETVIASSFSGFSGGPALASGGRVVVGERRGNGALRILAIDPRTRAATQLTAFGPVADPATYPALGLSGSGDVVTASLATLPTTPLRLPRSSRLLTVLPAVAELGSCPAQKVLGPGMEAAGGDGFVATLRTDCGAGPAAVLIATAAGRRTIPLATDPRDRTFRPMMHMLHATGPMVGWTEVHYPGGLLAVSLVVARGATGEVLMRAQLGGIDPLYWGLASDGTAVFAGPNCSLAVASPVSPAVSAVRLPDSVCPSGPFGTIATARGRVVYPTATGYAVTDLRGAAHALDGIAEPGLETPTGIGFDGRTVFAVRSDCDADRLLAIDANAPSSAPAVPPPGSAGACPVRRAGSSRLRVTPDGRLHIGLRCKAGCRGTLRLIQQRPGLRERPVGRIDYVSAGGTIVLRPRIARYARALAGCAGGLRVVAVLHPIRQSSIADFGQGLGVYRIVSGSRCQRGDGPPFAARRLGPRP